jgi:hypothetical protein
MIVNVLRARSVRNRRFGMILGRPGAHLADRKAGVPPTANKE